MASRSGSLTRNDSKLVARSSFTNGSAKVTYQEAVFNKNKNCEIVGCDTSFYFGGRHHCRVCGCSVCNKHCHNNIVLTSMVTDLPVHYEKVCEGCITSHKNDQALKNDMAGKIQLQWRVHITNKLNSSLDDARLPAEIQQAPQTPMVTFEHSLNYITSMLFSPLSATTDSIQATPKLNTAADSDDETSFMTTRTGFTPNTHQKDHQNRNNGVRSNYNDVSLISEVSAASHLFNNNSTPYSSRHADGYGAVSTPQTRTPYFPGSAASILFPRTPATAGGGGGQSVLQPVGSGGSVLRRLKRAHGSDSDDEESELVVETPLLQEGTAQHSQQLHDESMTMTSPLRPAQLQYTEEQAEKDDSALDTPVRAAAPSSDTEIPPVRAILSPVLLPVVDLQKQRKENEESTENAGAYLLPPLPNRESGCSGISGVTTNSSNSLGSSPLGEQVEEVEKEGGKLQSDGQEAPLISAKMIAGGGVSHCENGDTNALDKGAFGNLSTSSDVNNSNRRSGSGGGASSLPDSMITSIKDCSVVVEDSPTEIEGGHHHYTDEEVDHVSCVICGWTVF